MPLSDTLKRRLEEIEDISKRNLPKAAEAFEASLRNVLSEPGTHDLHSKPGEAPKKQSGKLVASIVTEVDPSTGQAHIGPTAPYAQNLLLTRPFYKLTIDQCRNELINILLKIRSSENG